MNSKLFKSWIANAMLAFAVSTVAMTVSTNADAKTRTVQVQDSYTFDEIFTLVQAEYPNAEKLKNRRIKIKILDNIKLILSLSENGQVLNLYSYWSKNDGFTLEKLNKINRKYNFMKLMLNEDDELEIETEINLDGVSKDYILSRIKAMSIYYMVLIPELHK